MLANFSMSIIFIRSFSVKLPIAICVALNCFPSVHAELDQIQQLGKVLFHDPKLSEPAGQSCASCHNSQNAFTDPNKTLPTSKGITGKLGSRNTPTLKYLATIPPRQKIFEGGVETFQGGLFLDGRVNTLEQQAEHPLLHPKEMNNPDKASILRKVIELGYSKQFDEAFGKGALNNEKQAFNYITSALASYQRSPELNPFSSKYDAWLSGQAKLNEQELLGLKLFKDEDKGNCAACHPSDPVGFQPPLFTDFTYDNLGAPFNPNNKFMSSPSASGSHFVDLGLGMQETLRDSNHFGKFKVPTLRNIELTAPCITVCSLHWKKWWIFTIPAMFLTNGPNQKLPVQ